MELKKRAKNVLNKIANKFTPVVKEEVKENIKGMLKEVKDNADVVAIAVGVGIFALVAIKIAKKKSSSLVTVGTYVENLTLNYYVTPKEAINA